MSFINFTKKKYTLLLRFLTFCIFFLSGCSSTPKKTPTITVPQIFHQAKYSTVAINIIVKKGNENSIFVASGILVDNNLVVTNQHILEKDTKEIWVFWDQSLKRPPILAKVVLEDKKHDLLLLKLSQKLSLPTIKLAHSKPRIIGEKIIILGFPEATQFPNVKIKHIHMFKGMIASIQKASSKDYPRLVLDARVLQGNSGGPVISLSNGKVIGVVSEIIIDSDEENSELPSGKLQTFSVEGESVGIAIPIQFVHELIAKYQRSL